MLLLNTLPNLPIRHIDAQQNKQHKGDEMIQTQLPFHWIKLESGRFDWNFQDDLSRFRRERQSIGRKTTFYAR